MEPKYFRLTTTIPEFDDTPEIPAGTLIREYFEQYGNGGIVPTDSTVEILDGPAAGIITVVLAGEITEGHIPGLPYEPVKRSEVPSAILAAEWREFHLPARALKLMDWDPSTTFHGEDWSDEIKEIGRQLQTGTFRKNGRGGYYTLHLNRNGLRALATRLEVAAAFSEKSEPKQFLKGIREQVMILAGVIATATYRNVRTEY